MEVLCRVVVSDTVTGHQGLPSIDMEHNSTDINVWIPYRCDTSLAVISEIVFNAIASDHGLSSVHGTT